MRQFELEVGNGIKFLNEHFGNTSWMSWIDLDKLNVAYLGNCIIGQITQHGYQFQKGTAMRDDVGFCVGGNPWAPGRTPLWAALTEEWRLQIREHLAPVVDHEFISAS